MSLLKDSQGQGRVSCRNNLSNVANSPTALCMFQRFSLRRSGDRDFRDLKIGELSAIDDAERPPGKISVTYLCPSFGVGLEL